MGGGEPKLKSENYTNFGGLNQKTSQYITEKNQFLTLKNLDASVVGSLTKTWGSTLYASGMGVSQQITGIGEVFSLLSTFSFSNLILAPTFLFGNTNTVLSTTLENVYRVSSHGITNIYTFIFSRNNYGAFTDYPFDFLSLDKLYFANSMDFLSYSPLEATLIPYSLPAPIYSTAISFSYGVSWQLSPPVNTTYSFYFRFIRTDGFVGPLFSIDRFIPYAPNPSYPPTGASTYLSVTVNDIVPQVPQFIYGNTFITAFDPVFFGISGLLSWVSPNNGATYYNYGGILGPTTNLFINASFTLFAGSTALDINDDFNGSYFFPSSINSGYNTIGINVLLPSININPSCLEIFNNQLFMAGFIYNPTYNQSTVVYSNIGEFEKIDPENFFEVRTDDGDLITSLRTYFTELVIFKYKTTHSLRGDNPDNFNLSEATGIYGCVSNNANCVFEQKLWFLDQKGICEYNGANTKIVSNEVQPIFNTMNQEAARKVASMIHVKERNEIWTFFPTGDNTFCDTCVIYDYLADYWYVRDNLRETSFSAMIQGDTYQKPHPFIGGFSGFISYFSQEFLKDDATSMRCVAKSRYIETELGHSQQKVFRRLFLDCDVEGSSIPIFVNFYSNQGTMPVFQATMILNQFQNRIDFGISAKDLSVEFIYSHDSPLRINGFTLEYRFQRAV